MPPFVGPSRNPQKRSRQDISVMKESKTKNLESTSQMKIGDLPLRLSSSKRIRKTVLPSHGKLESKVSAAVKIYEELLGRYKCEDERINKERRYDDDAQALAESLMTERYEELCEALRDLLPFTGTESTDVVSVESGLCYRTMHFHGRNVATRTKTLGARLEQARKQGKEGLAMDALCATLAALSCRREMCWLEAYDEEEPARGHFVHALVDPSSTQRLSFKIDSWRPASLLVTSVLSLQEALSRMDSGGPLKGFEGPLNQEFALQQIQKGVLLGDGLNEREPLFDLKPNAELQALLSSKKTVLMVEAYAALAPRDQVKKHGLGAIIKIEFAELLKQAKAQKQAVVFQLGGNDPHILAEKVYLKPPFTDYGLRIGYLRWRIPGRKDSKWAAERPAKDRPCIGLQMP